MDKVQINHAADAANETGRAQSRIEPDEKADPREFNGVELQPGDDVLIDAIEAREIFKELRPTEVWAHPADPQFPAFKIHELDDADVERIGKARGTSYVLLEVDENGGVGADCGHVAVSCARDAWLDTFARARVMLEQADAALRGCGYVDKPREEK